MNLRAAHGFFGSTSSTAAAAAARRQRIIHIDSLPLHTIGVALVVRVGLATESRHLRHRRRRRGLPIISPHSKSE